MQSLCFWLCTPERFCTTGRVLHNRTSDHGGKAGDSKSGPLRRFYWDRAYINTLIKNAEHANTNRNIRWGARRTCGGRRFERIDGLIAPLIDQGNAQLCSVSTLRHRKDQKCHCFLSRMKYFIRNGIVKTRRGAGHRSRFFWIGRIRNEAHRGNIQRINFLPFTEIISQATLYRVRIYLSVYRPTVCEFDEEHRENPMGHKASISHSINNAKICRNSCYLTRNLRDKPNGKLRRLFLVGASGKSHRRRDALTDEADYRCTNKPNAKADGPNFNLLAHKVCYWGKK